MEIVVYYPISFKYILLGVFFFELCDRITEYFSSVLWVVLASHSLSL